MVSTPKVSVIIPIYNTGIHFERCIRSIIDQTYTNLEIILINDGSTDNTDKHCQSYIKSDKRVLYFSKLNGGVSSARNLGIKKASGNYITFIDSDDIISRDAIFTLVSEIGDADISLIKEKDVTSSENVALTDEASFSVVTSGINATKMLLYENGINNTIHGLMYRTNIARGLYFNEDISYGEDYEFKFNLLIKAKNIVINSKVGYFYIRRDDSAMNSQFTNKRADTIIVALKNLEYVMKNIPELIIAAKHKVFLESLSVLRAIDDPASNKTQFNECVMYVERFRMSVILDKSAPLHHRVYALIALINVSLLLSTLNHKNKLLRR